MQRGTCGFAVKALNAQAAGAVGVVVMNEGQPGRTGLLTMIGDAPGLTIPVVFTTFDAGLNLAQTSNSTVRVKVDFTAEERTAYNVIAETKAGDPNNVVMAGAHLDSVQEGPGINDNGSGSAALLETAIQMQKVKPNNQVRFAWWGAEEEGLLGSEYYVANLTEAELDDIALYLNFDMVASPNYFFGIYDGDDSSDTAPVAIPEGSAQIEDVFEKFFADRGLAILGHRLLRPFRLRSVHRGKHPRRRAVHRRRGDQDRGRGRALRRCGRRCVRSLLPRHVRQPDRGGSGCAGADTPNWTRSTTSSATSTPMPWTSTPTPSPPPSSPSPSTPRR